MTVDAHVPDDQIFFYNNARRMGSRWQQGLRHDDLRNISLDLRTRDTSYGYVLTLIRQSGEALRSRVFSLEDEEGWHQAESLLRSFDYGWLRRYQGMQLGVQTGMNRRPTDVDHQLHLTVPGEAVLLWRALAAAYAHNWQREARELEALICPQYDSSWRGASIDAAAAYRRHQTSQRRYAVPEPAPSVQVHEEILMSPSNYERFRAYWENDNPWGGLGKSPLERSREPGPGMARFEDLVCVALEAFAESLGA